MDNKDYLILTKGRAVCLVLDTAIGLLNESFEIAKNNVRMEYNVEAKVRYSQGRIRCDKTYRYKLCRGASSVHEPILIGMSDDNIKFIVKEIKITDPKGNTDTFSNISLGKRNISGEDMLIGNVKLDKYNNEPYIRVTIKTTEYDMIIGTLYLHRYWLHRKDSISKYHIPKIY